MSRPLRGRAARAGAAGLAALAILALAAPGCERRSHLVPASADSSAHAPDSSVIRAREALGRWEDPTAGAEAARLTALLLRDDLARHADVPWVDRAHAYLDSLDIGAEVAGDRRVVAANLFSRAHPEGGSWPWLMFRNGRDVDGRPLAGQGLQLQRAITHPGGGGEAWDGVAVLFGKRAGSGQEPLVLVYGVPRGASWQPVQTLGPDSLGGVGTAEFQAEGDSTILLTTRTFRGVPRFEECATCPHMFVIRRFRWGPAGFARIEQTAIPSPYATFVSFVQALTANDRDLSQRLAADGAVLDAARRYGFGAPERGPWRVAPSTDETAREMVFFRGQQEAFKISFDQRGTDWVVSGILPTTRTVE